MPAKRIRNALADDPHFSDLEPSFIAYLAEHATEREFAEDETIFRVGDPADSFYLLLDGEATVEVPAIEGPQLELQALGAGAVLGWSWIIPPYRWSFQARARTPVEAIEFDGKAIREHCEQDPHFGYEILKRFSALMSERLEHARQTMIEEWRPAGFA